MHRLEAYTTLAFIFILVISIIYLPISFMLKKRGKSIIRQVSYLGLFCSIFLIIFSTILFTPISFSPETHTLNLVPFSWLSLTNNYDVLIIEKIPNIIIFIPFGLFIPVMFTRFRKWYKAIGISLLFTFCIELLQYFIGRSSDIDDIITNLLGAVIGYFLFTGFHKLFHCTNWWKKLNNL